MRTGFWCVRVSVAVLAAGLATIAGCDRKQSAGGAAQGSVTPAAPAQVPLQLDDCVVIGASVSAGAEVTLPGLPPKMLAGDANLADALAAVTRGPKPASFADLMFFMRPDDDAEKQLAAAIEKKPKVVFAIDYLFWHAYGAPLSDEKRRKLLERGLERLGKLDCTVVIGDMPDMAHAVGTMLSKSQVPPKELLNEFNSRIEAWAAGKKNVVLVSMRGVVAGAMKKEPVTLGGRKYEGEESRGLLVASGLHTSADGLIAMTLECLDVMKAKGMIPANAIWDHDPGAIKARLAETKIAEGKAKKDAAETAPTTGGK